MCQQPRTLSEVESEVRAEVNTSTPEGSIIIIAAQRHIAENAKARISSEGLIVRNLKGDVIAHPAIKIMADAQKIESGLLDKYGLGQFL